GPPTAESRFGETWKRCALSCDGPPAHLHRHNCFAFAYAPPSCLPMIRAATSWLQVGSVLGTRLVKLLPAPYVGQHVLFLLKPSGPCRLHPRIAADHSYFAVCLQQIG